MAAISRLKTTLDRTNTALVLFDALNGYLHPRDPAKVAFLKERNILPNLQRLLAGARGAGLTTFYPSGAHAPDGSDTVARLTDTDMDLKPDRRAASRSSRDSTRNSSDAEIAPELAPIDGDVVVRKNRWSSFYQTNLELQLRVRGIDTIVIAGGSTDVGIASTVFAARDMDLGIVVVRDGCYSARGNNNEFFLERVFPRMARVMTVDDAVKLMSMGQSWQGGLPRRWGVLPLRSLRRERERTVSWHAKNIPRRKQMTIAARHVDITTEDITCANGMPAFLAYPTGGGKFPTVVLMHERYGLVKHTRDQAMRCARDGFTVLAPNFFYKHPDQKVLNAGDSRYDMTDPGIDRADARRARDAEDPQGGRSEQGRRHGLLPDRAASAGVRRRDADHRRRGVVRRGRRSANGASTSSNRRRWKT